MRLIGVVALFLSGLAVVPQQQGSNTLEIVFGGGYAFIVHDGKTVLDVATVKKPHFYSTDYMHHPLKMSLQTGTLDETATTVRKTAIDAEGTQGWDFSNRRVKVFADGQELPPEAMSLPTYSPVERCDNTISENFNNQFFLPNLNTVSGVKTLHKDWQARFNGRLTLNGGTLAVANLASDCFGFRQESRIESQMMANGMNGIKYSRPFQGALTLRVWEKGQADTDPPGIIAIKPSGSMIALAINTRMKDMTIEHNQPIKHFKHFYWLLDGTPERKEIPVWLGARRPMAAGAPADSRRTPGEACPPGFYIVP
jgi:hypothetical protein